MVAVREDGDGAIEIELVEHAPPRRRARGPRGGAASAATPPGPPIEPESAGGEPGAPAARSAWRRSAALAVGVGAIGLVVGWLAGRAGGATEPSTVEPAAAPASTAPAATFGDDPALVEPAPPLITTSPDRRRLTTTTTVPEAVVVSPIPDIDPAVVGLPYEIVAEDGLGNLQVIDLASNTLTTLDAPRGGDMGRLFAGDGWVLLPNGSDDRSLAFRDGDPEPYWIDDFTSWAVFHAPGAGTMWRADDSLMLQQPGLMVEIDANGDPTGLTVPVPRQPTHVEADGVFIVDLPGGTFAVASDGSTRLTTGEVVALGPTAALVNECDESMACRYWVVDRASGDRRLLPGQTGGERFEPIAWWGTTGAAISPDGTLAIVVVPTPQTSGDYLEYMPSVLDLTEGTVTPLRDDAPPWVSGVQWTADSRFAMFLVDGEMLAYVRESGVVVRAGPNDRSVRRPQHFAMRPADGTPWIDR